MLMAAIDKDRKLKDSTVISTKILVLLSRSILTLKYRRKTR
jgi:hypothetical protein